MGSLLDEVNRAYARSCRLQTVELEITHRCTCSCVHCYLGPYAGEELATREIDRLFGELREEGVIYLTITGGEPFVRDDLPRVLELAHRERFLLTVMTTGIPIGNPEARLLKRTGVIGVEMSLLGATADTHDALMRHPGAFAGMRKAVSFLKAAGIEVVLKSTVLSGNYRELPGMRDAARAWGVPWIARRDIAPAIDGDRSPQRWTVNAAEAAELDAVPTLAAGPHGQAGAVLTCKAGKTSCAITPSGELLPCILFRRSVGSIRTRSLHAIWHGEPDPFLERLRRLEPEDVKECFTCAARQSCRRCPGIAYTETGELGRPSPSACRQGLPHGV